MTPRGDSVRAAVAAVESLAGPEEEEPHRFGGFGVTGVRFASGHLLALQRLTLRSLGRSATSVWHRAPQGTWTRYTDAEPEPLDDRRGTAPSAVRAVLDEITLTWRGEHSLAVLVRGARIAWSVHLESTGATRLMSAVTARLPPRLAGSRRIRAALAAVGGHWLGVGRIELDGTSALGQRFSIHPQRVWCVDASVARLDGRHLGPPVIAPPEPRAGGVLLPRWSLLVVGDAIFASNAVPGARPGLSPPRPA